MNDFFIVIALQAKEGQEEALRAQLIAVVEPSRRDEGNLRYEMFADRNDPRRFVFVEHWASTEAQHRHHTESEHIRRFNADGAGAVEKIEFLYTLDRLA
ncbi:Antibiotic biosynthesis monooxygenase [compost metagenome]